METSDQIGKVIGDMYVEHVKILFKDEEILKFTAENVCVTWLLIVKLLGFTEYILRDIFLYCFNAKRPLILSYFF